MNHEIYEVTWVYKKENNIKRDNYRSLDFRFYAFFTELFVAFRRSNRCQTLLIQLNEDLKWILDKGHKLETVHIWTYRKLSVASMRQDSRQTTRLWYPNSKAHGANMGTIWGRQDRGGPHVGPTNFAIWGLSEATRKTAFDHFVVCDSLTVAVERSWPRLFYKALYWRRLS